MCSKVFPCELFLEHLRSAENLESFSGRHFLSGFDIEMETLGVYDDVQETEIWESIWLHHPGLDFFLFLEHFQPYWVLWLGAFGPAQACKEYTCSITPINKDGMMRMEYVGGIHHVRASSMEVVNSRECLILSDATVKNLLHDGGIDVAVCLYPRATTGDGSANLFSRSSGESPSKVLRRSGRR